MGSPNSGYLTELTFRLFETKILKKSKIKESVWIRYVDDISIICDHVSKSLDIFLLKLNELDSKIMFTSDIDKKDILTILDIK